MVYSIEELKESDYGEWDSFVNKNKELTIFHTIKWKNLLEEVFHYEPQYYSVKNSEGKIVGISPAFKVKKLIGSIIISMPFFEYGGFFVEDGYEDAYDELFSIYREKVDNKEVKGVKIRSLPTDLGLYPSDYSKNIEASGFYLDVKDKDFEKDIWYGLWNKKTGIRTRVNKSIREGVIIKYDKNPNILYNLLLMKHKRLGTPPFPKSFLKKITEMIGDSLFITTAYFSDEPISSMMSIIHNKRLLMTLLGSDIGKRNISTEILFKEHIEYAVKHKFDIVDFGRSEAKSHYEHFKLRFQANKFNIYSYTYPAMKIESNYKYKGAAKLFQKIPWLLTNTPFGPWLRKKFP